jgi:hypothetical protein
VKLYYSLTKFYRKFSKVHMTGSPAATVKLLPCDHEVMGLSPGSNLL